MEEKEKHTFSAPFHQQQQGWSPVTAAAAAVASSSASYRANQVMNQIAVHPLGLANNSSNSRVPPDHHHHHQHPLPQHHNHHDMFAAGSSAAVIHHRPPPESSSFAAAAAAAAAANSASSSQFLGFRDLLQGGAPLCFGYGQRIGGSSSNSAGHVLPLPDDLNSMEHKSVLQQMQMMQPLMLGAKMMTAQEMVEAKALAASKSHSEAERRRRERINKHLATLRSLLPNTTKTDKASLLAEVIEHVKELKRLVEDIGHSSPVPSESDEVSVDPLDDEGQQVLIRASLCCDDRPDLLTDLIKTLRTLRLRAVKAEMATLGGRVKNVFVVTSGNSNTAASDSESLQNNADAIGGTSSSNSISENCSSPAVSVSSIQEALKAVLEKHNFAGDLASASGSKRQRHVGQFGSSSSSDKAPL